MQGQVKNTSILTLSALDPELGRPILGDLWRYLVDTLTLLPFPPYNKIAPILLKAVHLLDRVDRVLAQHRDYR